MFLAASMQPYLLMVRHLVGKHIQWRYMYLCTCVYTCTRVGTCVYTCTYMWSTMHTALLLPFFYSGCGRWPCVAGYNTSYCTRHVWPDLFNGFQSRITHQGKPCTVHVYVIYLHCSVHVVHHKHVAWPTYFSVIGEPEDEAYTGLALSPGTPIVVGFLLVFCYLVCLETLGSLW